MRRQITLTTILGALLFALAASAHAAEKDYILTAANPNKLYLIDLKRRAVARAYDLPDPAVGPSFIEPSPDGRIAYVVANQARDIIGIELISGKEVFRAHMPQVKNERVVNFGLTVSPDGAKIYSYEIPVQAKLDRYEAQPNRIAVYAANGGLDAKAEAVFVNMPRRIRLLLFSKDGQHLYALGSNFYTLDPETGRIIAAYPLRQWQEPDASPYDTLNFWPTPESSDVFTAVVVDGRAEVARSYQNTDVTALFHLDLKQGVFTVSPIKGVQDTLFAVVASPDKRFAFGGFRTLSKIDLKKGALVKRVDLDRSYYQFNVSRDGREVYISGAMCDIVIHDAGNLEKKAVVLLPDCADMAGAAVRVVRLDLGK